MINWIKGLFSSQTEQGDWEPWFEALEKEKMQTDIHGLTYVKSIVPMPKVKPTKGKDISEPIISFVKCVQENPKRFEAHSDTSLFIYTSSMDIEQYTAYKIWDKESKKGWYIVGRYYSNHWFVNGYPGEGGPLYTNPFFLTEDEKEYILREVKEVMGYRVGRKTKLEQIRKERRIRDERNRLKEIYQ